MTVAIVVSAFREKDAGATALLLKAAEHYFNSEGINYNVYTAPGSLEIPQVARLVIAHKKPAGILALGVVVRGETIHFDVVVRESARALLQLSMDEHTPIINGILPVEDAAQAATRAHRGATLSKALISLIHTTCSLRHD